MAHCRQCALEAVLGYEAVCMDLGADEWLGEHMGEQSGYGHELYLDSLGNEGGSRRPSESHQSHTYEIFKEIVKEILMHFNNRNNY